MSFGAIGFMSNRNKSGRTLVNPKYCSAVTWSRFILQTRTSPLAIQLLKVSVNSVLFLLLENTFPGHCILGPQQEIWKKVWSPQTLKYFRKSIWRNLGFHCLFCFS